jgi:hypothetical protein
VKLTRTLAVVLLCLAAVVTASPARAATKIDDLTLESQTPWVGRGGSFSVRLDTPPVQASPASDLEYAISVYPASTSRSAFTQTLTTRPRTAPLAVITIGATEAVTDSTGAVTLDVGVQDPALPRDRTRVGLRGAGVYPVSVDLRTIGADVHARLLTHLIYVPETPTGPRLAVGVIVPLRAPLALRADGTDVLRATDVNALTSVASTLATLPNSGTLLAPSPETLAALARSTRPGDRTALSALQAVGRDHLVVDSPFVPTQSPAATTEGREVSATRGREVITEVMAQAPNAGVTVVTDPNDDRLGTDLPSRLIVSDSLLQPATQRVTTAEPVSVRRANNRNGAVPALIADAGLAAHFDNKGSPVLRAHHLLADLATIYFDSPGRFRSVVVNPTDGWRPNANLLAPLLAGLESSPILEAAAPDRLFALATKRTTPRSRVLNPVPTPPALPANFPTLRRTIDSLRGVMGNESPVAQSFADRLLIAASAKFDSAQRRDYIRGLTTAVTEERHKFQLPSGGSLTITARRSGIPITVRSSAGYDAHVILQIASDRLRFPGGATRSITLTHQNTTQRFTIQTLGSGNVPLRVLLKSPDGRVVLAQSRLTVRSRNASGVGVALSAGALLVLLVWWYRHAAQRRREPTP